MDCAPPLCSAVRLEMTKSIVDSLASILQRRRSNKSTADLSKYGSSDGPWDDLEMSRDPIGHSGRIAEPGLKAVVTHDERQAGSQQNLVKSDGIHTTTETDVSYSPRRRNA